MEAVGGFHPVGHDLQRVLEHLRAFAGRHPTFPGIVSLGVHAGQGCRGQAHELHGMLRIRKPLVAQALGHARDQELHNAVGTVGAMAHEVQRPADDAPVAPGGQPAGDAQHAPVRVDGVKQPHTRVAQFFDAAERELHFRQRLELRPLLGNVLNLFAHVERRLQERGLHIGHAVALGLVDGGAHILPFLAGRLPAARVHDHFAADLDGAPADLQQRVALFAMHAVEHRRKRPLHAILGEAGQVVHPLGGLAERPGAGQGDAVEHAICHGRFARGREPVAVAFPRSHEAHRFAAGFDQPLGACLRPLVRFAHVAHPADHHDQHHDPEHQADALIHDRGHRGTRHERQLHMAQEADGQEAPRQFGQQRRGRGTRREFIRLGNAVHQVHGGARQQNQHDGTDAADQPAPADANREVLHCRSQGDGEDQRRQGVRHAGGDCAVLQQGGHAIRRKAQRHDQVIGDGNARREQVDGHGAGGREPTSAIQAPRQHQSHGGGQQRAQYRAGHRGAHQVELQEAAAVRGAGQAARERAVVDGDRTHEQADCAERPRVIMRGDGDDRPQRQHHGDGREHAPRLEGGAAQPVPSGFGVRGRPGHHAADRVSDQRGGENAVIARIAAVKQRDQNRHVADQPNTPPQQMAAERAGRHKRADRQHQRAQGELHAGDELGVLEQPSGRRTQDQAHDHAAERAGERGADGTCAAKPRLGD